MDDLFDAEGKRTTFVLTTAVDVNDGKEYLHIKAKKETLPFVVRRRLPAAMALDYEMLAVIGADMQMTLDLAEESSENGNLAPTCEIEEEEA